MVAREGEKPMADRNRIQEGNGHSSSVEDEDNSDFRRNNSHRVDIISRILENDASTIIDCRYNWNWKSRVIFVKKKIKKKNYTLNA